MADMWMATGLKNLEQLEAALADGAKPDAFPSGGSPMGRCAEIGWPEGIRALAKAGADPNLKSERGDTPLITAVVCRKLDVIDALLDLGADPELPNKLGATPAHYACYLSVSGSISTQSYVIENGVKRIVAVQTNDEIRTQRLAIMKRLLARGANCDAEDGQGFTALMRAAQYAAIDFAHALLETGADPNHANAKGYQAIHAAAGHGDPAMVDLLLDAGASPSAADSSGFTPLHDAAASGNTALATLLLSRGADKTLAVTAGWENITPGMTPAQIAQAKGHEALVGLLT